MRKENSQKRIAVVTSDYRKSTLRGLLEHDGAVFRFPSLTQLSQLNGFSDDLRGFPGDKSIHCNNSLSKTVAVKTYPLSL